MPADDPVIEIAGAGPAGLAAAITLARAGRRVLVHEAQHEVGHRFGVDLQGLENWSEPGDVLERMREAGFDTGFEHLACLRGTAFDAWDRDYPLAGDAPLFYLVERGPGPRSLDSALLGQALALGVQLRFGSRVRRLDGPGILATGPKQSDAIAIGYQFDTSMQDGFWLVLDDRLAPRGYAYLLVMNGRGTIKSCMFANFEQRLACVERTVERFGRLLPLEMRSPRLHAGVAALHPFGPSPAGEQLVVGERAGFQDALAGFGIRYALRSGVLAASAMLAENRYDTEYDVAWRREIAVSLQASIVRREQFGMLGNRGYRWLLKAQASAMNSRAFLRWLYSGGPLDRLLYRWARRRFRGAGRSRARDRSRA